MFAFVGQCKGNGNDNYTTGDMDTTGANLLVWCSVRNNATTPTFTDSKGNTWNVGVNFNPIGNIFVSIYYAFGSITVGTGHNFTSTLTDQIGSSQVWAFSGAQVADPLDQAIETKLAFGATTVTADSITPTMADCLAITNLDIDVTGASPTINQSFTSPGYGDPGSSSVYHASYSAYRILTTAVALTPTWTRNESGNNYMALAIFRPAVVVPDLNALIGEPITGHSALN